jgi:RIO kinase 1
MEMNWMSRVDKFNPLSKGSTIDQKRDELRGGTSGKATIEEPRFEDIKQDAIKFGLATDVLYPMSAGKEATIFLAKWNDHSIILKAYRLWTTPHKLSMTKGHIRESSGKKTRWILGLLEDIAVKEYDILQNCYRAGVRVPTPISRVANYLTMRFIGDGDSPAPQLREVELENPEAVMNEIFDQYLLMYQAAHFAHGDLSAYNILWWKNQPWIIDVPQTESVNKWCDMNRIELILRRDITNVLSYFESYGVQRNPEHILSVFLDAYIPDNLRNYKELRNDVLELL